MGITTKNELKGYFKTGKQPTQENFEDLIDSLAHEGSIDTLKQNVNAIDRKVDEALDIVDENNRIINDIEGQLNDLGVNLDGILGSNALTIDNLNEALANNERFGELYSKTMDAENNLSDMLNRLDDTEEQAKEAQSRLDDYDNDNIITPIEKSYLRQELKRIESEFNEYRTNATQYSLLDSNEYKNYVTAHEKCVAALNKYTSSEVKNITVESDYQNISDYYDVRQALLIKFTEIAKDNIAEIIQESVKDLQVGGVNLISNLPENWVSRALNQSSNIGLHFERDYETLTKLKNTSIVIKDLIPCRGNIYMQIVNPAYQAAIMQFDKNKLYLGIEGYHPFVNEKQIKLLDETAYILVAVKEKTGYVIRPDAIANVQIQIEYGKIKNGYIQSIEDQKYELYSALDSIDDMQDELNRLNENIEETLSDGIIDAAEAVMYKESINNIKNNLSRYESNYNSLLDNPLISENSEIKSSLNESYSAVVTSANDLMNILNVYIELKTVDDEGRRIVDEKTELFSAKLTEFETLIIQLNEYLTNSIFEGINVDNRNLLRNSSLLELSASSSTANVYQKFIPTVDLKPNTNYAFSIDKTVVLHGSPEEFQCSIYNKTLGTLYQKFNIKINTNREFIQFKTPSNLPSNSVFLIYCGVHSKCNANHIQFINFKLEESLNPSAWSPAPEDLQDAVNNAQEEARQTMSALSAINDDNTFSVPEKKIVRKEWEEIKNQTNGSYWKVLDLSEEANVDVSDLTTAFNSLSANLETKNELYTSDNTLNFDRNEMILLFSQYYNEEILITNKIQEAYTNKSIDGIELGGTNLIGRQIPGISSMYGTCTKMENVNLFGEDVYEIAKKVNGDALIYTNVFFDVVKNNSYTASFYIKNEILEDSQYATKIQICNPNGAILVENKVIDKQNNWSQISVTFKNNTNFNYLLVRVFSPYKINSKCQVSCLKVETGSKPTAGYSLSNTFISQSIADARQEALFAQQDLLNMKDDDKISPLEKTGLKSMLNSMYAEQQEILKLCETYGVSKNTTLTADNISRTIIEAYNKADAAIKYFTSTNNEYISISGALPNGIDYDDIDRYYDFKSELIKKIEDKKIEISGATVSAITEDINEVSGELNKLSGSVSGFSGHVYTTFKDGIITSGEAFTIREHIKQLKTQISGFSSEYNDIKNNPNLIDPAKSGLNISYTALTGSLNSLIGTVESAITDGKITSGENNNVTTAFTDLDKKITAFTKSFENARNSINEKLVNDIKFGGTNLICVSNSDVSNYLLNNYKQDKFMFSGTTKQSTSGIKLTDKYFTYISGGNNSYCVSFKFKITNDISCKCLGGHWTGKTKSIFIDNIQYTSGWTNCVNYTFSKNQEYAIKVIIETDNKWANSSDKSFYIQPNRNITTGTGVSFSVWDIQLEEASKPSTYSPSPTDVEYYSKQEALEVANSKNQTFTTQPTKYRAGDLWVNEGKLYTSSANSNTYNSAHWYEYVKYDNTQITMNAGCLVGGTLSVAKDKGNVNAGLTGLDNIDGTVFDSPVRFWAGSTFEGRETAAFRVFENGECYASRFYGFNPAFVLNNDNINNFMFNNKLNVELIGSSILWMADKSGVSLSLPYIDSGDTATGLTLDGSNDTELSINLKTKYVGSIVTIYNPKCRGFKVGSECCDPQEVDFTNLMDCTIKSNVSADFARKFYVKKTDGEKRGGAAIPGQSPPITSYTSFSGYNFSRVYTTSFGPNSSSMDKGPSYVTFLNTLIPIRKDEYDLIYTNTSQRYFLIKDNGNYYYVRWVVKDKIGDFKNGGFASLELAKDWTLQPQ